VTGPDRSREHVRQQLRPTGDCIPVERFDGPLTDEDARHLAGCPRCQAELALWRSFAESTTEADEADAVRSIAERLRARDQAPVIPSAPQDKTRALGLRRWGALAASLLLAGAIGYIAWDREPSIGPARPGDQTYRTGRIDIVSPSGDLTSVPGELVWSAVDGAVRYDVAVLEVDRTVLWSTSSPAARVSLPAGIVAHILPGKTLLWSVTARNASGDALAASGMQQFRVTATPSPRDE
jgi:hypothetical protein